MCSHRIIAPDDSVAATHLDIAKEIGNVWQSQGRERASGCTHKNLHLVSQQKSMITQEYTLLHDRYEHWTSAILYVTTKPELNKTSIPKNDIH